MVWDPVWVVYYYYPRGKPPLALSDFRRCARAAPLEESTAGRGGGGVVV